MRFSDRTLAVYYHMPFILLDDHILSNSVIGIFVESLLPFFKKVIIFGFESVADQNPITYSLPISDNLEFVSLGPEGQFWNHLGKMSRLKKAVKPYINKIGVLLLRVPSHLAYAVWKYSGRPENTALLFIGNPFFTSAYSNTYRYMYLFRKIRSDLHDRRMKIICRKSSAVLLANNQTLVKCWGNKLKSPVSLVHTSSISNRDIISTNVKAEYREFSYRLLFVGRVCYDKGIRELFRAIFELNKNNEIEFFLDIVGTMGDLGGKSIKNLVEEIDVAKYVKYHGVIPFGEKLYEYYRNADVYILPSYHEGMPKTIWESMSQGTPVIASEIDGMKENFINEEDILFIKPHNPKSIVEMVMNLCNSPELVKTLRKNGLERAKKITRETQAERIVEILKDMEI
jgi:glycosyltransferase involved in cell wall biosynthesis